MELRLFPLQVGRRVSILGYDLHGIKKYATEMSEEKQENRDDESDARGDLALKQDRNKHHCQGHLLRELRYHSTCVKWSTSKQESTTNILLKFRRK